MTLPEFHLHLISDSTGDTVHSVSRACLAQYDTLKPVEHMWPMVRNKLQVEEVIQVVKNHPGLVIYTLVDQDLSKHVDKVCKKMDIPCVDVLGPLINKLTNHLGEKEFGKPGLQHTLDDEYFKRIEALQFVLKHDDGQEYQNLEEADVVLVGVSRTSKTPTCIYLANRGIKAANIPFVPNITLPDILFELNSPLVVGLTCDPKRLVDIRSERLDSMNYDNTSSYADMENVRNEILEARKLCRSNKWPILDVSRRSIEETSAEIIKMLTREKEKNV